MRCIEDYSGSAKMLGIALEHFGRAEYGPDDEIRPHSHGHYELCLITSGAATYEVEDLSYSLEAGDACITRPGEMHAMRGGAAGAWSLFFLGVRELDLEELATPLSCVRGRGRVLRGRPHLLPLFEAVLEEARASRHASLLALHAMTIRLLVEVTRELRATGYQEIALPYSGPVAAAMDYIGVAARYDMSVAEIAAKVGLSPSWLAHTFKQETGLSLRCQLRRVLMERAKRLLEDDVLTVSEVGYRLGFPGVACFSAFFRKGEGSPPTSYRRKAQAWS